MSSAFPRNCFLGRYFLLGDGFLPLGSLDLVWHTGSLPLIGAVVAERLEARVLHLRARGRCGDGIILATVRGMVTLSCRVIRAVFRFSSAILADRVMRGLAISFAMLARVALSGAFLPFLCCMGSSCPRAGSRAVPFCTVAKYSVPVSRKCLCSCEHNGVNCKRGTTGRECGITMSQLTDEFVIG